MNDVMVNGDVNDVIKYYWENFEVLFLLLGMWYYGNIMN